MRVGLHLWESRDVVVVLGRSSQARREVNLPACRADSVRIFRRRSGGGAVVLGPGCLIYSLCLSLNQFPALCDVRASYGLILRFVIRALDVSGLEMRGQADLALGNRKVSGNAQRRERGSLLHHGTLLYDFDARLAARYLLSPPRPPEYRAGRDHADFLGNLPLTAPEIRERLARFYLDPIANR